MGQTPANVADTRADQMFPTLSDADIARLRRFGDVRRYAPGDALVRVGDTGHGLMVLLQGSVDIHRIDQAGVRTLIVRHEPQGFVGELAQLSGRPALVEAHAVDEVEALIVPPDALRALLIGEAEIGERIMRALILRRVGLIQTGAVGPVIVGHSEDRDVVRLEGFLARNGHPLQRLDPAVDAEARALVERFAVAEADLPIVLCPGGELLRNPSEGELARCIGLVGPIDACRVFDAVVVGAGPSGLAAAVYAASEGLSVLVLDCRAFGGQAGASSRIENYLGFPTGISGMALMARAFNQAQKFGVEMAIPDEAVSLEPDPWSASGVSLVLADGERVRARAVILATGARYRRLEVEGLEQFEGSSVHYWASPLEAKLCSSQDVVLVGGGNSAGQAVVFLAGHARKVWLLIRGRSLDDTMSRYLVDRIANLPNVEVVSGVEVSGLEGAEGALEAVRWRPRGGGDEVRKAVRQMFLFIGAEPNTDWLRPAGLSLDARGFIRTGEDAGPGRLAMETSRPGVFAIGDVRSGSVKRVAAAVGDGAQVVPSLHTLFARETQAPASAAAKMEPA